MKRQTLVAVMAILETDQSISDEQSDLVSGILNGQIRRKDLTPVAPAPPPCVSPKPEPKQEPKEYMNMKEAAEYISMSTRSIDKYKAEGELPYHKVGGKVILKRGDLDGFMSGRRVDVTK